MLDGEIVLFDDQGRQDFDALGQRIHPAESRINMLAEQTPTRFIAFDLLAEDDETLLELPQHERRTRLEKRVEKPVDLTPVAFDADGAQEWLQGAEGVVAKQLDAPYMPGERTGMVKIKRVRTIDAVVQGWRPGKEEGTVGSLILGLYDDAGELRTVGHTSGFSAKEKRELPAKLAPYETGERGMADRAAGPAAASWSGSRCGPSWWSRSPSTTPATIASATGRRSRAGATTSRRPSAGWISSTIRRPEGDDLIGSTARNS